MTKCNLTSNKTDSTLLGIVSGVGKFLIRGSGTRGEFIILSTQANKSMVTLLCQLNQIQVGDAFFNVEPSKQPIKISEAQRRAVLDFNLWVSKHSRFISNLSIDMENVIVFEGRRKGPKPHTRRETKADADLFYQIISILAETEETGPKWIVRQESNDWADIAGQAALARMIRARESKTTLTETLPTVEDKAGLAKVVRL